MSRGGLLLQSQALAIRNRLLGKMSLPDLTPLLASRRFLAACRFPCRGFCCRKLEHDIARHGISEAKPVAKILEVIAERVKYTDHFGPSRGKTLETRPLTDDTEGLFAGAHKCSAAEALEFVPNGAMRRDKMVLL